MRETELEIVDVPCPRCQWKRSRVHSDGQRHECTACGHAFGREALVHKRFMGPIPATPDIVGDLDALRLKVLCFSCSEHIWYMDPQTERGIIKDDHFKSGPYPSPQPYTNIATSCPVCNGMPLASVGKCLYVVTNQGLVPKPRSCP